MTGPDAANELTREIGALIDLLTASREALSGDVHCSTAALYSWSVGRRVPRRSSRAKLVAAARERARALVECVDRIEELTDGRAGAVHPVTFGQRLRREHRALRGRLRKLREDARSARERLGGWRPRTAEATREPAPATHVHHGQGQETDGTSPDRRSEVELSGS